KAIIWAVALGSGTSGGVLAPLLIMGGCVGALFGGLLPHANPGDWALVGMAATMGGTMRAPLTAMMFAIELTGDAALAVPLLAACGASYAFTVLVLKRSILTEKVARRGYHIMREYSVDPLDLARVSDVMVSDVDTLPAQMTVGAFVTFFTADDHRHRAYPVLDRTRRVIGLATRADALAFVADPSRHAATLAETLANRPMVTADPQEPVSGLVNRMVQADAGRVPVVRPGDGVLVGLIARSDLMRVRARLLAEEGERRAFLGWRRRAPSLRPNPAPLPQREESEQAGRAP
ncbi:MAG: chloride channel protein, partial [Pseudomonadota bacterium]|nr:chloride channel protein [Pseudomonadota bacterium]